MVEHWNLFRNEFPNLERGRNCFLGSTTSALPGTTPSFSACITAMNLKKKKSVRLSLVKVPDEIKTPSMLVDIRLRVQ